MNTVICNHCFSIKKDSPQASLGFELGYHGSRIVSDHQVDFSDFSESFTENPWHPGGGDGHPEDDDGIFDKIAEFFNHAFNKMIEFFKNLFGGPAGPEKKRNKVWRLNVLCVTI